MATQANTEEQKMNIGITSLQTAINSLINEKENEKILENMKISMEYLTTFSVCEVDKELLQWIMPIIRTISEKIYDDNTLLSDTADDDFVIDILKGNLHMALDFLTILKTIFEYLLKNDEIDINDIPSVTTAPAKVILSTFEHCRNSSINYKQNFKEELLQVFNTTLQVHSLFIRLFHSCLVLRDTSNNSDGINILHEVLNTICDISNSLSDLSFKPLVMNWKAYINIAQKFSGISMDHIDLRKPIACLNTDILKNLSLISDEMDCNDTKINVLKKSEFLMKIALRILDIFWNTLERVKEEVLILCCIIFSFLTESYLSREYLQGITTSASENIHAVIWSFIDKLVEENKINSMLVTNQDVLLDKHYFGLLNFSNACLGRLVMKDGLVDVNLADIVRMIFACTRKCFSEFALLKNIFDSIVINVSACVLLHQYHYGEIETILLEHILQEDIWSALLAMDIWILILKYSTEQSSLQVCIDLLQKYHELNFGINTYRLEDIYLRCFIQRVFKILPNSVKYQLSQSVEGKDWKITGFDKISATQNNSIEQITSWTVEKAQKIGSDEFTLTNFVAIMENLGMLSLLDFHGNNMNVKNLVDVVEIFWEYDKTDLRNGIVKYFVNNLCKITRRLITEFSNKQLFKILNRLKALSCEDSYKLHVLDILSVICDKNANEFGQDGHKFSSMVSNILHNCLTPHSNNLIKQNALEITEKCSSNGKEMIVRDLAKSSVGTREDISNYLQKRTPNSAPDKKYFIEMGKLEYAHNCLRWRTMTDEPALKKFKPEKDLSKKALGICEEKKTSLGRHVPRAVPVAEAAQTVDNVHEAITNIRGEVKSLMNVLKTDKLSAKNVSDLKIIVSQLSSLM